MHCRGLGYFHVFRYVGVCYRGSWGALVYQVVLGLSLLGLVWWGRGNGCLCASWVFSCVGARARPAANRCFASCAISYSTIFISNNRALFHLWWKENLIKHQKVSKYYENDSSFSNSFHLQGRFPLISVKVSTSKRKR